MNKPMQWRSYNEDGTAWDLYLNGDYIFTWVQRTDAKDGKYVAKVNGKIFYDFPTIRAAANFVHDNLDLNATIAYMVS